MAVRKWKRSAGDGGANRGALLPPAWNELVHADRIHHGAGEDVAADLAGFFDHGHADRRVALFQPNGRGEPRRTGPDDDDIGRDALAVFSGGHGVSGRVGTVGRLPGWSRQEAVT